MVEISSKAQRAASRWRRLAILPSQKHLSSAKSRTLRTPQLFLGRTIRFMDLRVETRKAFFRIGQIGVLGLRVLWKFLHLLVGIWYQALNIIDMLESCFISCGLFKKYKSLDVSKLQYLAIVIESEEACQTYRVIELLRWVAAMGIKHICLYDMEGVLQKSKEAIIKECDAKLWQGAEASEPLLDPSQLTLEFASLSDGKEGVAKAANLLFVKYLKLSEQGGDLGRPNFTEPQMEEALRVVGFAGPEPDLLLVYGPARCHLGFPAWRIRYTEILHMGPLKSMRYGSLIKAIHRFTTVLQNYGK
ncbi:hypothetical protein Nepgr_015273 [Nepenthes gracilis]|uniref:ditrans,polycis-polyprenyl diphosphate synthase [(2E,6E)-farnesyldiphosphate specific] n=1 Tax=Nepenthes gracilis TaxID=150966 RepID=A0AAD3SLT4_NEPGR|nr:hypothetical protein Nepgr_015273 [Nepenthes gracilis]